jgi:hypothetical protein
MTPLTHPILLAQAEPAAPKRSDPFLQRGEDWLLVGLMAGALIFGALVVWFVDRWRKRITSDDRAAGEELTSFRAMYERGEITEEEYNRLRTKVATRVKPKPAAAGGQAPATEPTAPAATDPTTAGGNPAMPPVPGYFADEDGGAPPAQPPRKPWDRGPNGAPPPA